MLMVDNTPAAKSVAIKIGLDYRARLLPEDKVNAIIALSKTNNNTLMVCNGINDAHAMKEANVVITMGSNGTDVTFETDDAALTK